MGLGVISEVAEPGSGHGPLAKGVKAYGVQGREFTYRASGYLEEKGGNVLQLHQLSVSVRRGSPVLWTSRNAGMNGTCACTNVSLCQLACQSGVCRKSEGNAITHAALVSTHTHTRTRRAESTTPHCHWLSQEYECPVCKCVCRAAVFHDAAASGVTCAGGARALLLACMLA